MDSIPSSHMRSTFQGLDILRDLGVSYVEGFVTSLSPADTEKIRRAFDDWLHERISYEACRRILLDTVGRDDSLARVQDILNLPEEPIPYHEEKDGDENALTFRKKTRTWTPAEDQRLLAGVARFGPDNWQTVAQWLGSGRNRAQCSQRWTRGLNPRISKKGWTPEEDAQLEELVRLHGDKSWTKIASVLGNRCDVQCRYHYKQLKSGNQSEGAGEERQEGRKKGGDFRWKKTPARMAPQAQGSYMPLTSSRTWGSQPRMSLNQGMDLAPLAPLKKSMLGPVGINPWRPPEMGRQFGVCGSDPASLDMFLKQFE